MWAETWQNGRNVVLWVIEVIRGCGPTIRGLYRRLKHVAPRAGAARHEDGPLCPDCGHEDHSDRPMCRPVHRHEDPQCMCISTRPGVVVGADPSAGGHGVGVVAYRRAHDGLLTKIMGRCPFCREEPPDLIDHVGRSHPDRAAEWGRGHGLTYDPHPEGWGMVMPRAMTSAEWRREWERMADRAQAVVDGMGHLGQIASANARQALSAAAEDAADRERTRALYESGVRSADGVIRELQGIPANDQPVYDDGEFTASMVREAMERIRDQYLNRLQHDARSGRLHTGEWSPDEHDMIQSPECPSNEILLCSRCSHPSHAGGNGRCAFQVPPRADGSDGHEGMYAMCECGWAESEPDVQFEPIDYPEPLRPVVCGLCGHGDHSDHPDTPCGMVHGEGDSVPCPCLYIQSDTPIPMDPGELEHRQVTREGDPAYNDLQTYLEGGTLESTAAAKRLDQRGVDLGQISPKTFWDAWGELPRPTYNAHKIWCARSEQHMASECPVWGAE